MKLILSIDPGVTGAWAIISADDGSLVHVGDLPIIERGSTKWVNARVFHRWIKRHTSGHHTTPVIEWVHAMPKNGAVAGFSQGGTMCSALAILQLCYFEGDIEMVSPITWKRQVGLVYTKDMTDSQRKAMARKLGQELFPTAPLDLVKSHNRAEALLIGHWYLRHRMRAEAA